MKILYLQHGLGNQMFQYAYVKYLESQGFDKVWIDSSAPSLRRHHGLKLRRIFPEINKRGHFVPYVVGRPFHICCDIMKLVFGLSLESEQTNRLWIRGYWQNSAFVDSIRDQLLNDFIFKKIDDAANIRLLDKIRNLFYFPMT